MALTFTTLRIGFALHPVSEPVEASRLYRAKVGGRGASSMPEGQLINASGEIVGRVSYNGRVWPDVTYKPGDVPIYCPSVETL